MANIKHKKFHLYNIDIENNEVVEVRIPDSTDALTEWVSGLVNRIISEESRQFVFHSKTTEVHQCLRSIVANEDSSEYVLPVAERLLRIELVADERYKHLKGIVKGSLVIAELEIDGFESFVLAKVEYEKYIDETDLNKHEGLPFEHHIYKTCLVTMEDEYENDGEDIVVKELLIGDSNSQIAAYWSDEFLESRELKTDELNTVNAFKAAESLLKAKIGKKYPGDYKVLRNNLIGYFRTSESYSHTKMVEHVIGKYQPNEPDLNINAIKDKLLKLPNEVGKSRSFDSVFEIKPSEIKAKYKSSYRVTDQIEIRIKDEVPDIANTILAVEEKGKKYIKIETDVEGFNEFKRKWA